MSDLFGNHVVGFPTRRHISFKYFSASDGEELAKIKKVKIIRNNKREGKSYKINVALMIC